MLWGEKKKNNYKEIKDKYIKKEIIIKMKDKQHNVSKYV